EAFEHAADLPPPPLSAEQLVEDLYDGRLEGVERIRRIASDLRAAASASRPESRPLIPRNTRQSGRTMYWLDIDTDARIDVMEFAIAARAGLDASEQRTNGSVELMRAALSWWPDATAMPFNETLADFIPGEDGAIAAERARDELIALRNQVEAALAES